MKEGLHGVDTFLVKRTLKIIKQIDEILKKKGCDASNIFDEEVPEQEMECSDDEVEKELKRIRKLRKKGDLEDGELLPDNNQFIGKKRPFHKSGNDS